MLESISTPHKILTGRKDKIRTLRKVNGLSGFTKDLKGMILLKRCCIIQHLSSAFWVLIVANQLSNKSSEGI